MSDLFREQVTRRNRCDAGIVVPWSVPYLNRWAWLLALWLILAVVLLAQVSYADKVSVAGVVQPLARPVVVRSADVGVVTEVQVKQADLVGFRQPVVLIDKRMRRINGASPAELKVAQLEDRLITLLEEQSRVRRLGEQEQRMLAEQLHGVSARNATVQQQLELARKKVSLVRKEQQRALKLTRAGWLSASELQRTQGELLNAQQVVLDSLGRLQSLETRSRELQAQMTLQQQQKEDRLAVLAADAAQIEHQVRQAAVSEQVLIVAPVKGRVLDLVAHPGQPVSVGSALLTLVPGTQSHDPVEVFLSSNAAGRVREGMPVRIRYAGYPYQKYGAAEGEVSEVSEVNRADGPASERRPPSFRARIDIVSLPEQIDRIPAGMAVTADILLRSQPLWAWLLEPALNAFARL